MTTTMMRMIGLQALFVMVGFQEVWEQLAENMSRPQGMVGGGFGEIKIGFLNWRGLKIDGGCADDGVNAGVLRCMRVLRNYILIVMH